MSVRASLIRLPDRYRETSVRKPLQLVVQLIAYTAFAGAIVYFSQAPAYHYRSADLAAVKVSISHATQHVEPCITLTPEEIAALAPNMRNTLSCARERQPLQMEVDVDGETVLRIDEPASGLWSDGPAVVYESFQLPAGTYQLAVRLRDSGRMEDWDYSDAIVAELLPGRYFTIKFRPETGGFVFR